MEEKVASICWYGCWREAGQVDGGESYNYKYDNGWERHHIHDDDVVDLVVIKAWRGRSVGCE